MKGIIVMAAIALAAAIGGDGSAEAQETKACPEWMRGLTMKADEDWMQDTRICKDGRGCKSAEMMEWGSMERNNRRYFWLDDMRKNLTRMGVSKMRLCEYHRKYSW